MKLSELGAYLDGIIADKVLHAEMLFLEHGATGEELEVAIRDERSRLQNWRDDMIAEMSRIAMSPDAQTHELQ